MEIPPQCHTSLLLGALLFVHQFFPLLFFFWCKSRCLLAIHICWLLFWNLLPIRNRKYGFQNMKQTLRVWWTPTGALVNIFRMCLTINSVIARFQLSFRLCARTYSVSRKFWFLIMTSSSAPLPLQMVQALRHNSPAHNKFFSFRAPKLISFLRTLNLSSLLSDMLPEQPWFVNISEN